MKNDEVLSRLQNLIGYLPLQKDLIKKTGINQSTLSTKKARNSNWTDAEIAALNVAYNIDICKGISHNNTNDNFVSITYRPEVFLSAGYGIEVLDESKETITLDSRLLVSERGNKINPKCCEVVSISGNSMFPEYRHGDKVIIDRADIELLDGQIFAFRYKNKCYVKEINMLGDKIKCISLNKEYDSFYINEGEEFTVLGRILPRIRL